VPALLVLLQFTAAAAGQPGPYGRFALLLDIALGITVMVSLTRLRVGYQVAVSIPCVLVTCLWTFHYLSGLAFDCSDAPSRLERADKLAWHADYGEESIAVFAVPAPYVMPPVNLFQYRVLLMPKDRKVAEAQMDADLIVMPWGDRETYDFESYRWAWSTNLILPTRISWANKPFVILQRGATEDEAQLQP
jgi:hypothetical protein